MTWRQFSRLLRLLWRDLVGSGTLRALWVFCACLLLGVTLIAASSGLLGIVKDGLSTRQRAIFGGDLVLSRREPLGSDERAWLDANADVSLLVELRTMLGTEDDDFTVVELQSVDARYPLYGEIRLAPAMSLEAAVSPAADGTYGAVFDPVLASTAGLAVGQRVSVGEIELELRAEIVEQPDRSLSATTRGPPLLIGDDALAATGLLTPMSLVDYDYRVRTDEPAASFRARYRAAFPESDAEIRTLAERSELVAERLDQVASVLLLVGLTTLFIGGLGVANSIAAWIATKRATLATLQALGARQSQIAVVFIGQVLLLAALSSAVGAVFGSVIAWYASRLLADALPLTRDVLSLIQPTLLAILFGVFAAIAFALPALGRALAADPVRLLRGDAMHTGRLTPIYRHATLLLAAGTLGTMAWLLPDPLIGVVFVVVLLLLVLVFEGVIRALRHGARRVRHLRAFDGRFALQVAAANLYRPGNTLRPMLLSLGSSLTLLTAAALVIAATLTSLNETVPARAPALVFYDIQAAQREAFEETLAAQPGFESAALTPLVLGRLTHVNGQPLADRGEIDEAEEANDEQKLSYRVPGIDNTAVDRGAWWPEDYAGPPLVAYEDREADQIGLEVGDTLRFVILGEEIEATLAAIYRQARFETNFWLEGVFSDGVLDAWITRYIGNAHLQDGREVSAMRALGAAFPNVVTIRTSQLLDNARQMLAAAGLAVALVGAVSLLASLLVMSSVIAATTQRRIYDSAVMHAVGARYAAIRRGLLLEYAAMAVILSAFAFLIGGAMAWCILEYWLKLPQDGLWLTGITVASIGSVVCLAGGAAWLMRTLQPAPATLLRRGG